MDNVATLYLNIDASRARSGVNEFNNQTQRAEQSIDRAERSSNSFMDALKKIGIAAGVAAVGITTLSLKLSVHIIRSASDANEALQKFLVLFGEIDQKGEQYVNNLTKNYGLSVTESRTYLSDIMALLKGYGVESSKAAEMASASVIKAMDLAAFSNKNLLDVMGDIKSAYANSFETMLKYGTALNSERVNREALSLGLVKHSDHIDANARSQAALSLIIKDTSESTGHWREEMHGLAGQQNIFNSNIDDLSVSIGSVLLPMTIQLLTNINQWLDKSKNLNLTINTSIEVMRFFANTIGTAALAFTGLKAAVTSQFALYVNVFTKIPIMVGEYLKSLGFLSKGQSELLDGLKKFKKELNEGSKSDQDAFDKVQKSVLKVNKSLDESKIKLKEQGTAGKDSSDKIVKSTDKVVDKFKDVGSAIDKNNTKFKEQDRVVQDNQGVFTNYTNDMKTSMNDVRYSIDESIQGLEYIPTELDKASMAMGHLVTVSGKLKDGQVMQADSNEYIKENITLLNESNAVFEKIGNTQVNISNVNQKPFDNIADSIQKVKNKIIESAGGLEKFNNTIAKIANKKAILRELQFQIAKLEGQIKKLDPSTQEFINKSGELAKVKLSFESIKGEVSKLNESLKQLNQIENTALFRELTKDIDKMEASLGKGTIGVKKFQNNITTLSREQAKLQLVDKRISDIESKIKLVGKGTKEWIENTNKLNRLKFVYDDINTSISEIEANMKKVNNNFLDPELAKKFDKEIKNINDDLINTGGGLDKFNEGLSNSVKDGIKLELVADKISDLGLELDKLPKYSDKQIAKQVEIERYQKIYDIISKSAQSAASNINNIANATNNAVSSMKKFQGLDPFEKAAQRATGGQFGFVKDGKTTHVGGSNPLSDYEKQYLATYGVLPPETMKPKTTTRYYNGLPYNDNFGQIKVLPPKIEPQQFTGAIKTSNSGTVTIPSGGDVNNNNTNTNNTNNNSITINNNYQTPLSSYEIKNLQLELLKQTQRM